MQGGSRSFEDTGNSGMLVLEDQIPQKGRE